MGMYDQQRLRPACAYAQSDQSLCVTFEYSMSVKLLTEHHLEFLSLKRGCTGSHESTPVKMPLCWISHGMAQILKTTPHELTQVHMHIYTNSEMRVKRQTRLCLI